MFFWALDQDFPLNMSKTFILHNNKFEKVFNKFLNKITVQ